MQTLFCIDKARKRSFTEVALNSVLEENAASAIDFEWEFYSPNNNIYEQCICCVSQLFHRGFNPGTLRIARSAVHTLRSVRKQTRVRFLNSCPEWGSLTIRIFTYFPCYRPLLCFQFHAFSNVCNQTGRSIYMILPVWYGYYFFRSIAFQIMYTNHDFFFFFFYKLRGHAVLKLDFQNAV